MSKKFFLRAACFLVLLISVAGVKFYNQREPMGRLQKAHTKLTFWTVGESYADYMRSCAQRYNELTDGEKIDLDVQVYSRSFIVDQINKSLLNDYQVPDLADIRFIDMHQFVNSAEHGMFLYPLGSLLTENEKPRESALAAFSFNNTLLALPYGLGEMVLFVNENVMREQGIDPGKLGSWEELFSLGEELKAKGIGLFALDVNNWDLLLAMMLQQDADAANSTGGIVHSQAYSQICDLLRDAVKRGWVTVPEELDIYNQRFYRSYLDGGYLCVIAPLEYANELIRNMPGLFGQVRIYPLPGVEESGTTPLVAQYGTAILARSKNIRLAKDFLAFARLGESCYRDMVDTVYVRSISAEDKDLRREPDAQAFKNYFGSDALSLFTAQKECSYTAASGLPKEVSSLAAEFLSLCDN